MTVKKLSSTEITFVNNSLEAAIRIGLVFLLLFLCFDILKPFLLPLLWGIIIAVASHPLFKSLKGKLGGKNGLAATVFTLIALTIIIAPATVLSTTLFTSVEKIATELQNGKLIIPPPPSNIADWPVIGKDLHSSWTLFSQNLEQAVQKFGPQLSSAGNWVFDHMKSAGAGVLQFIISIIIAGVLHASAKGSKQFIENLSVRLAGDSGLLYCQLSGKLIQSVTLGILGVAIIQAILAGLGFMAAGVPAAGLWAFIVLFLGVIQVGPMIIILPIAIYMLGELNTLPGIVFFIYSLAVALIDNFLKPVLLSRGIDAPMVVVFLGAIGGFISFGIIGLFVGAILLVLGWVLLMAWVHSDSEVMAETALEEAQESK
ncbi:Predicted PurR-regulated permease PerM [Alteromonadaceae bacterium Bs31]|nr:Predicted PurR-regulated permease PerM [Alteromonadaceae bacterium Bs31]